MSTIVVDRPVADIDVIEGGSSGPPGPQGAPGPQGPAGPPGSAGHTYSYQFSTNTSEPPTGNQLRLNAAHPYTTATKIWAVDVTADGADVRPFLLLTQPGSILYLQDKNDHTKYGKFELTAPPVGKTGYVEFPVAWTENGNALAAAAVELLIVAAASETFISGTGPPAPATGTDGAIYLDVASGRMWGPKIAGAWPAQPLGRVMPLQPTYAQLQTG
jgi:hypothetical protein